MLAGSSCNYQNGSGESYSGSGAYGYTPSAVWVAAGCRATFVMCTGITTCSLIHFFYIHCSEG